MSESFPPPLSTREVPGPRAPLDHPMRPDLPRQRDEAAYADDLRFPFEAAPPTPRAEADEGYARWRYRVAAVLIDVLLQVPFVIAEVVGYVIAFDGGGLTRVEHAGSGIWNDGIEVHTAQLTSSTWTGLVIADLAGLSLLVFSIWNNIVRQGRRGASIGKQCMNLMVVSERTARPIGVLLTFLRGWLHVIDLVPLGLGYLWPLWDGKRQTFTDMAMGTAVLHLPPRPQRTASPVPAQITPTYDW